MTVELPLFPLGTVLFPSMPLGLHVFEERYRQMVTCCLDSGTSFGVVAIREGVEVGPGAIPYEVGTLAHIREIDQLPDGRYTLVVVGASRFRISSLLRDKPYLRGRINYLEDVAASVDDAALLARQLRTDFERYVASLRSKGFEVLDEAELPDEPELLSYVVAASLRVERARRQALLELNMTEDRLRACSSLLRRERGFLDQYLTPRERAGVVSPN